MTFFYLLVKEWLSPFIKSEQPLQYLSALTTTIAVLILAVLFYYMVRQILWKVMPAFVKHTKSNWDDVLLKNNFFRRLSHLAPALVIYFIGEFTNGEVLVLTGFIAKVTKIYFVVIFIQVLSAFLDSVNDIYNEYPFAKERPIKGYLQLVMTLFYAIGGIIIFSSVFSQDPIKIFTGLGAMAAVILLVFKDTILGFVASIQVAANKMVKIGDWIELPGQADGTVEEINLTSVKVQNWDKTISTLPTYSLVSSSVRNWKGMEESGGRRIKRSINIDMSSIRFCDEQLLTKIESIPLIQNEVKQKQQEIVEGSKAKVSEDGRTDQFGQTNIGAFRLYLETYLKEHPLISKEMTFLVRQLQSTDTGLPVEIYVFSKKQSWPEYERVQADIMDHLFAVLPFFELSVFQNPTGYDIKSLQRQQ